MFGYLFRMQITSAIVLMLVIMTRTMLSLVVSSVLCKL